MPKKARKCIGDNKHKSKYKLWKQSQLTKFGESAFREKEAERLRLRRQMYREKFGKIKKPKLTPAERAKRYRAKQEHTFINSDQNSEQFEESIISLADVKRRKAAEKMRLKRQAEEHIFINSDQNSDQFEDTKISVADVRRRIAAEKRRLKRQSEKNIFINSEQFEETKNSVVDVKTDQNSDQFEETKISVADVKRKIAAEKMRLKRQSEENIIINSDQFEETIISVADVKRKIAAEKMRLKRQSEEHIFINSDQNSDHF